LSKTLLDIIEEEKFELTQRNEKWVMVCPFHKGDHDPSFTIYPTGTYYCWGCEAWGDALKFLVEYKSWTTKEALDYLGDDYKLQKQDKSQIIKIKNLSLMWKFIYNVAEDYHQYLLKTTGPINYLVSRGLEPKIIQHYKLGYTDGRVLKLFYAWERQMAFEAGITNKNGYEALSHRITIPNLINSREDADFLIGRTVVNDRIKYLGIRVPKPLFGYFEVRYSPILFIVEGQIDWLLLRQWGYPAVNLSGHHLPKYFYNLLKDKFLVIVPDYDENNVGQNAAQSLHKEFPKSTVLDYSRYRKAGLSLDIGELALQDNAKDKFDEAVMEHLWNIPISPMDWASYLPISSAQKDSHLTLKLQDSLR
jgi:DNA primase